MSAKEKEDLTAPDRSVTGNAIQSTNTNHFVEDEADFDTAMANFADGDTITLKGGETFDLSDENYTQTNKSMYLIGQSPRPTIQFNSGSGAFLSVNDTYDWPDDDDGEHVVVIDNVKFETGSGYGVGTVLIRMLGHSTVTVTNSEFDLYQQSVVFGADSVTVQNCAVTVEEGSGTAISILERRNNAFNHLVKDCTFNRNDGHVQMLRFAADRVGGGFVVENVDFEYTDTGAGQALTLDLDNDWSTVTYNVELVDCDFDDKKVYILDNRSAPNIIANILCENNNSDIAGPCLDDIETDLFMLQDDTVTVNYTFNSPWHYQSNQISLENLHGWW